MAEDKQPIGGDAEAGSTGTVEARFTQDDLNRIAAKERRAVAKLEQEHEALKAKLAGFEEAQKSESQKAIEAAAKKARAEADAEWSGRLTAKEIDAKLELKLLQSGYDPDLAHVVKAKSVLTSIDDIDVAIKTALEGKTWAKAVESGEPRPVSQPGSPSGMKPSARWNSERLAEMTASGRIVELTPADWAEIKRATQDGSFK